MQLTMETHVITKMGLVDAQVCSAGTYDEALEYLRRTSPAGTENNWQKNEEGSFAPLPCADDPGRTHYMFIC